MPPLRFTASIAGRFAKAALAVGEGEVCALFHRSFYLRLPGERYACVGDRSLGCGPLNALVEGFQPASIGTRLQISLDSVRDWLPPPPLEHATANLDSLRQAARGRVPAEGLGCLVVDTHNALSGHAQPALEAIDRWLVGNAIASEADMLIGLGPGLTPSGDDFLGGVMIALHQVQRKTQAQGLWRWLQPRLPRTSAISGAHLEAAAAGEGHEALHRCLETLFNRGSRWDAALDELDNVGHCSGWDALAGAVAVTKTLG